MKTLVQQDMNILEMTLLSFNQVSRPEIKQVSSVKIREREKSLQHKTKAGGKIKTDINVPVTCKHIIQVIEENINKSELLTNIVINQDESQSCNVKTKKSRGVDWYKDKCVWPIKNGLYYVTDGTAVAVSFYDKEKCVFYVLEKLDIKYWSPTAVTLLQ